MTRLVGAERKLAKSRFWEFSGLRDFIFPSFILVSSAVVWKVGYRRVIVQGLHFVFLHFPPTRDHSLHETVHARLGFLGKQRQALESDSSVARVTVGCPSSRVGLAPRARLAPGTQKTKLRPLRVKLDFMWSVWLLRSLQSFRWYVQLISC